MYRSNYKRYRKKRRQNIFKNIFLVILLFIIGFITAFFFLGDNNSFFDLSFDAQTIGEENVTTTEENTSTGDTSLEDNTTEIIEQGIKNDIKGLYIDANRVSDDNYFNEIVVALENGVINTLVIPMKNADGSFNYKSGVLYKNASFIKTDMSEFIKKALELDVYLIADVYTYSDNEYINNYAGDAIVTSNSGVIFLDGFGSRWISPYSENANTYLKEVLLEVSNFGFDEIMLSGHSFPQFGKTNLINFNGSISNEEILANRVSEFKTHINMPISINMTPYYFSADNLCKQDAGLLQNASDRLYFTVENEEQIINVSPFPNVGHFSNNTNLNNNIVKTLA